ncbi:MAG: ABC transporter ATP-binding protein [Chloroflexi bacterium]|nr:MAG: ABC transporter ATP-binding protein [Chloroflexota bacterium]
MDTNAIVTQDLTRDFGSVRAVDGLTLEVPNGIVFGFLGPNGAGKTTTIRLLLGLLAPTGGSAQVLGYDVIRQADEIRTRTGALLEHHGLYERLSAEDNLEFYGRIYRMPAKERQARIRELLEHIGLWERRKDMVGNWSRGMKQKLAVARTLLAKPALVFLDEPTAGLDPMASVALREDLAGLAAKEGITIFLNTHNLGEAEKLCRMVGVIRDGKLQALGSVEELRMSSGRPKAIITGSGFSEAALLELRKDPDVTTAELSDHTVTIEFERPVEVAPIVSFLVSKGAQVEEVRKGQASLEDVFMTLMQEEQEVQA